MTLLVIPMFTLRSTGHESASRSATRVFGGCWSRPKQPRKLNYRSAPWLYGPAATGAWALFSAIAYVLISSEREPNASLDAKEGYQCLKQVILSEPNGCWVCANQAEKTRLAAVTAGFALTITAWVAGLSFVPYAWMDWLGKAPPWAYCIVTVILWWTLSATMYPLFRASPGESA